MSYLLARRLGGLALLLVVWTGGAEFGRMYAGHRVYWARGWVLRLWGDRWAGFAGPDWVLAKDTASDRLMRHEKTHIEQWQRHGLWMAPLYLWLLWRYGYDAHPMEIEARAAERRK